ncbi:MAG: hypothetical protein GX369_03630 [Euryarchaeota archaeon]|nr:hypothetical protein [Euryarchaeota archaeon]
MSVNSAYKNISGIAARVSFSILLILLVIALFKAILTGRIFWSLIAIWTLVVILTPEFGDAILSQRRSLITTMISASLFIVYIFLGPTSPSLTDFNSLIWAIPGNIVIFSLVMITLLVVNERGHGHMVRQFMMVVTLISYIAVIILQGPIDYFVGMFFGKELVSGNDEFMRYFIFSTATGVIMTYAMVNYMREKSGGRINPSGIDWRK